MSDLDGSTVHFATDPDWQGLVLGDADRRPGWVRVQWVQPVSFIGTHRLTELVTA